MAKKEKNITKMEMQQHDYFTLIKKDENVHVCLGNTIVSGQKFKTFEEAKKYVDSKPYELIINTACLCMDINLKTKKG